MGNEKGSVENKVGYFRRNFFVLIPEISNVQEYNKNLLRICDIDNERNHYQKKEKISSLLKIDENYLIPLNKTDYEVVKFEYRKVNKYGFVDIDTNRHSVGSRFQNQEVLVKITAHKIYILDKLNRELVSHNRVYAKN